MPTLTLLLPGSGRLPGTLPPALGAALGRARWTATGDTGERAQLQRYFELLPRGWPVAALTRRLDAGDTVGATWLRADPAWLRPDINGARMMACGERLQLTQADVDALLPVLRPVFGDAGFSLDAPVPSRWYLRLPQGSQLPVFADPEDVLGADLFDFMPRDADALARRWRTLDSEAQVLLHNHPWNARRIAAGKPPVNALWLWGGGTSPDAVHARVQTVASGDALLRALAIAAAIPETQRPPGYACPTMDALVDLRDARDLEDLAREWLLPAIASLHHGQLRRLALDFADGRHARLEPSQRWRLWRRPLARLLPPVPADAHA